jgi:hypothetical protein
MALFVAQLLEHRNRTSGMAVFLSVIASACCGNRGPGTTGPGFTTAYDSTAFDTLLAYVADTTKLRFETIPAAVDDQRLMLGTCPGACTHGPRVRIEPESLSYRNKIDTLRNGPGRIIARMINSDTIPYPKFNLGGLDTVYWAITRADTTTNPDSLSSVSLYISIKGLRGMRTPAITTDTGFVDRHPYGYYGYRAKARWLWSDSDETGWGTCAKGACCH